MGWKSQVWSQLCQSLSHRQGCHPGGGAIKPYQISLQPSDVSHVQAETRSAGRTAAAPTLPHLLCLLYSPAVQRHHLLHHLMYLCTHSLPIWYPQKHSNINALVTCIPLSLENHSVFTLLSVFYRILPGQDYLSSPVLYPIAPWPLGSSFIPTLITGFILQ